MVNKEDLFTEALELLKRLISIPSFSREEDKTAALLFENLKQNGFNVHRKGNNVWAYNEFFDPQKPSILLNSHHDTVKPNSAYTRDPFEAKVEKERLYGLGSNDAGGAVVALWSTFKYFNGLKNLKYNLVLALTAEEEISGKNGIESILEELPSNIEFALVGEPTHTQCAIAGKGLMVLDCVAHGVAGHAAREEGTNAIYLAMKDIEWFQNYQFPKVSETLGPIKMTVTKIQAGELHNVVPATCHFTVDIRITEAYTHEEVLDTIQQHIHSKAQPRSMRLRSSSIDKNHPIVRAAVNLNKKLYGSPTSSDQALIPYPSMKCGPGASARSHSADEYIYLEEIKEGIDTYIGLLTQVL